LILGLLPRLHTSHKLALNMFAVDSLVLDAGSLLFDTTPDLDSLPADSFDLFPTDFDWPHSTETSDGEDVPTLAASFSFDDFELDQQELLSDEHLLLATKLWTNAPPQETSEFERILTSSSASPTDDLGASDDGSSDAEADVDDSASSAKLSRRKSSTSLLDEDFNVKKMKGKKGVTKKTSKNARRFQDVATLKTINQLRAEAADHPDSRRRIHNVLERKRRNDLKYCYHELRESIPDLEGTERAPTGTILARAAEYVRSLQEEEKRIDADYAIELAKFETLSRQLGKSSC